MATSNANPAFNAEEEVEKLHSATKGKGCDEEEIIKILTRHNEAQRDAIKTAYEKNFGKDLSKLLKDELKGRLEQAILGLITPHKHYVVEEIKAAMKGAGARVETLIDILIPASTAEILQIKDTYRKFYERDLDDDIKKELKGEVRDVFVAHLLAARDTGTDSSRVAERVDELKQAMFNKKWDDDTPCVYIFNMSSYEDLNKISNEFHRATGQNLEAVIRAKTKGDFEKVLLAIVQVAKSRASYFAERLSDAMAGKGCDEKTLIRILLLRSEIDMDDIKTEYMKKYGRALDEAIKSETKGDLQTMALALIN